MIKTQKKKKKKKQHSDAGEARTRGPTVSSQALYHWATTLRSQYIWQDLKVFMQKINEFKVILVSYYK